ncbi:MAG: HflK protein [Methylophilaceae bacterium 17-44-8]|jgi:membrane protease subunit HflK|nr:MAG: HflK protein [Methylophilales bacterium 28-44-11]OZA05308.1 MAG: HflK protein [Methylophilaceae bacterium 17-44-8]
MIKFPGFWQRNNEGPPDLDEVFRDLSKKINNLFGGSGGGGNTPSKNIDFPIVPIIGLVALVWLATGFYIVDQGSRGLVLRFGQHVETTLPGPRWHLPFPIESVENVNLEQVRTIEVGYRSAEGGSSRSKEPRESLMLTNDENIIDLQFAVQYNLKDVEDFQFKNRSTEDGVRGVAETAIREIVGKSRMDFALYEGREEIAVRAKKLMQEVLDRYQSGINVVNVTMQNAQPPEQVQAAFDDAVKAKQDLERQKNEGQAYANDVIPKARGTAARLAEEAAGYKLRVENEAKGNADRFEQILTQYNKAPEVTRQRMYIDAQEQIMSNTNKVLIDQKGGNSLLYLPLDKLMERSGNAAQSANTNAKTPATDSAQIELDTDRSRDAFRSRDRDVR